MKRRLMQMAAGVLAAGAGTCALAAGSVGPQSLNHFRSNVLPVLVRVDATGKVVEVSPSEELSPRIDRLLRQNLDELISKPAHAHGRAIASQFVMNLALKVAPRPDGSYDARFLYVSSKPVPSGSWYWVHEDGHRLALVNRLDRLPVRHERYYDRIQPYRWSAPPSLPTQNTVRSAAQGAPRTAPRPGH